MFKSYLKYLQTGGDVKQLKESGDKIIKILKDVSSAPFKLKNDYEFNHTIDEIIVTDLTNKNIVEESDEFKNIMFLLTQSSINNLILEINNEYYFLNIDINIFNKMFNTIKLNPPDSTQASAAAKAVTDAAKAIIDDANKISAINDDDLFKKLIEYLYILYIYKILPENSITANTTNYIRNFITAAATTAATAAKAAAMPANETAAKAAAAAAAKTATAPPPAPGGGSTHEELTYFKQYINVFIIYTYLKISTVLNVNLTKYENNKIIGKYLKEHETELNLFKNIKKLTYADKDGNIFEFIINDKYPIIYDINFDMSLLNNVNTNIQKITNKFNKNILIYCLILYGSNTSVKEEDIQTLITNHSLIELANTTKTSKDYFKQLISIFKLLDNVRNRQITDYLNIVYNEGDVPKYELPYSKYKIDKTSVDKIVLEVQSTFPNEKIINIIPLKKVLKYSNIQDTVKYINPVLIENLQSALMSAFGKEDIFKINENKTVYPNKVLNQFNEVELIKADELTSIIADINLTDTNMFNLYNYDDLYKLIKSSMSFRDKLNIMISLLHKTYSSITQTNSYKAINSTNITSDTYGNMFAVKYLKGIYYWNPNEDTGIINTNPPPAGAPSASVIDKNTEKYKNIYKNLNKMFYVLVNMIYLFINYEVLIVYEILKENYGKYILPILLNSDFYKNADDYIQALYIIKSILLSPTYLFKGDVQSTDFKEYIDVNKNDYIKIINESITNACKRFGWERTDIDNKITDFMENKINCNKLEFNIDLIKAIPKINKKSTSGEFDINLLQYNPANKLSAFNNLVLGGNYYTDESLLKDRNNFIKYYDEFKDADKNNVQIWGTYMLLYCILNPTNTTDDKCLNTIVNTGFGLKDQVLQFIQYMKLESKIKMLYSIIGDELKVRNGRLYVPRFEDISKETFDKLKITINKETNEDNKKTTGGYRFFETNITEDELEKQKNLFKIYIIHMLIDSIMYDMNGKKQNYQTAFKNINDTIQPQEQKDPFKNIPIRKNYKQFTLPITSKLSVTPEAFSVWLKSQSGGNLIDGGGIYANSFKQYYDNYRNTLKGMGYKMSDKDKTIFENALNKFTEAEDALQNYFSQYNFFIEHYKEIKDKYNDSNIDETKLKNIRQQMNEAFNKKQAEHAKLLQLIQKLNLNTPKIIEIIHKP